MKRIEAEIEIVTREDNAMIQAVTDKSKEYKFIKESQRLKEKFESLQRPSKLHNYIDYTDKKDYTDYTNKKDYTDKKIQQEVHDMTKDGIDKDVRAYLSLGPVSVKHQRDSHTRR